MNYAYFFPELSNASGDLIFIHNLCCLWGFLFASWFFREFFSFSVICVVDSRISLLVKLMCWFFGKRDAVDQNSLTKLGNTLKAFELFVTSPDWKTFSQILPHRPLFVTAKIIPLKNCVLDINPHNFQSQKVISPTHKFILCACRHKSIINCFI